MAAPTASLRWMLDTNMVSYALKGTYPAVRAQMARRPPAALCISAVTQSELLYGVAKNPAATRIKGVVDEFLRWVEVLDWSAGVAAAHGALRADLERRGVGLGAFDLMIAAHALALDAVLVSNDRAFAQVPGLKLDNWAAGED
ncbi:MAG: type II toxin-antitoxin system VapC family toxin [Burkholderiales bacterium]|nr:type II toxin-antitoxin system VapC family toxin [Burkholderiales bacterium]